MCELCAALRVEYAVLKIEAHVTGMKIAARAGEPRWSALTTLLYNFFY